MKCLMRSVACAILVAMTATVDGADEPFSEVEIRRGEQISELKVFIVNPGQRDFEFPTGARGHGGDVPPGETAGRITGIKVIPRLTFEWDLSGNQKPRAKWIEIHPPVFSSNWQFRGNSEPEIFVVRPGERRLYYEFKVPTEYVRGKFAGGHLPRPDLKDKTEKSPGYGAPSEMNGAMRITRLIEVGGKKATAKDDKR